jgi:hypothetical protein
MAEASHGYFLEEDGSEWGSGSDGDGEYFLQGQPDPNRYTLPSSWSWTHTLERHGLRHVFATSR